MKKLQIAVGIIRNENNEIFITRRAADAHMANKLEFPGGKIEMGETPVWSWFKIDSVVWLYKTILIIYERWRDTNDGHHHDKDGNMAV